jgi:hypothetical protein
MISFLMFSKPDSIETSAMMSYHGRQGGQQDERNSFPQYSLDKKETSYEIHFVL